MPKQLMFFMCACALALSACDNNTPVIKSEAAAISPYKPTATFQEIMDSVVDPSSDFIWDAVSTTVDATGIHEKQPRTDAEWHEIRRRAILLAEAANLIAVPGRRVASGDKTVEEREPLDVTNIQRRLDTNHEQLVGFANALREVSVQLVAVADKKDVAGITELGGTLDEVCESCHKVFWYPDQVPNAAPK
jgi:hypothetical protein